MAVHNTTISYYTVLFRLSGCTGESNQQWLMQDKFKWQVMVLLYNYKIMWEIVIHACKGSRKKILH